MSGYNPLTWRPPDDTDNTGMTVNPLATQSAPQPGVSTSDAWTHITNKVGDFLAAQRADAEAKGLWNPETGFPSGNGLLDAIKQYSGAMLAGTTAPGGRGIIAYHGSPHDFDAFDMSKIGTGEGAQAYGYGVPYLAGNEGVARGYRDALSKWENNVGQHVADITGVDGLSSDHLNAVQQIAMGNKMGMPVDQAAKALAARVPALRGVDPGPMTDRKPVLGKLITAVRGDQNPGHMYQVHVNAEPEQFLDWNKPASEQSPSVQAALNTLGVPDKPHVNGEQAYYHLAGDALTEREMLQKMFRDRAANGDTREFPADQARLAELSNPQAAASAALAQHGIPGIRYLDAGSRASGEGTHNYVMFDPKLVTILRKYGLLGTIGGAAAASGGQDQ